MSRKVTIFLIVIIFLGIVIRAVHYKWDLYDSDEAIVGVMAMHILSGERWERLEEEGWGGEFFWSGTHLLKYHEPGIDFRCKPGLARFIRVSLTGYDGRFDWSIAEITVWVEKIEG